MAQDIPQPILTCLEQAFETCFPIKPDRIYRKPDEGNFIHALNTELQKKHIPRTEEKQWMKNITRRFLTKNKSYRLEREKRPHPYHSSWVYVQPTV